MLNQHLYTGEKLREIETGRVVLMHEEAQAREAQAHSKPVLAPVARSAGHLLHTLGHRLEIWASPPEEDARELHMRTR
jgi:hypothetical protein